MKKIILALHIHISIFKNDYFHKCKNIYTFYSLQSYKYLL